MPFFFLFSFFLGEVFLAISLLDLTLVLEMRLKKKKKIVEYFISVIVVFWCCECLQCGVLVTLSIQLLSY